MSPSQASDLNQAIGGRQPSGKCKYKLVLFLFTYFCFSLLSFRSKSKKISDTSKILGCSNRTTCSPEKSGCSRRPSDDRTPQIFMEDPLHSGKYLKQKNVYSCFRILSDLFSHQGQCKVSMGDGFRRLLTRFFLLFFFLSQFL